MNKNNSASERRGIERINRRLLPNVLCFLFFTACVGTSLVLLCLQLIPFSSMKHRVDALSYSGGVEFFTNSYWNGVVLRGQITSVFLVGLAMLCLLGRKHLVSAIAHWGSEFVRKIKLMRAKVCFIYMSMSIDEKMILWCVMVIGVALRLYYLNQPVHGDEARTFTAYAYRPFLCILGDWSAPNNHIFHSLCVRVSYLIFGKTLWALRMPAFLAGILLIPLSYLWGVIWNGRQAGLLTAALVATGYPMVVFSVMGRGYTIVACCVVLLFLSIYHLRQNGDDVFAWSVAVSATVVGIYCIPIMLYAFFGAVIWVLWDPPEDVSWKKYFVRIWLFASVCGFLVLLLYLPAFVATDWGLVADDATLVQRRDWGNIIKTLHQFAGELKVSFFGENTLWTAILWIGGICMGLFHSQHSDGGKRMRFVLAIILAAFCIPLMIQRVVPYGRIYVIYYPICAAIVVAGLQQLVSRMSVLSRKTSVILVCFIVMVFGGTILLNNPAGCISNGDAFSDGPKVASYLKNIVKPHDRIIGHISVPGALTFYFTQDKTPLAVSDIIVTRPLIVRSETGAVYVVLNTELGHTLDNVYGFLAQNELVEQSRLIAKYDGASIYVLSNSTLCTRN